MQAITGDNSGEIVVSWDEITDGKATYGIYWSTSPGISGGGKENAIWAGKDSGVEIVSSPFIITGLESDVTYYFRVALWDGELHLSEEVSAVAK